MLGSFIYDFGSHFTPICSAFWLDDPRVGSSAVSRHDLADRCLQRCGAKYAISRHPFLAPEHSPRYLHTVLQRQIDGESESAHQDEHHSEAALVRDHRVESWCSPAHACADLDLKRLK